jgi:uracil phosphoribosyltransferase
MNDGSLSAISATGGSAIKAVEVLKEHGVPEERIIFINLVRKSYMWNDSC